MKKADIKIDISAIRADFPIFKQKVHGKPLIYLDSAATAQKPQVVIDSLKHFYAEEYGTVHRAVYALAAQATAKYSAVREIVREFLNAASRDEIIFTKGATEAINLVAQSFAKAYLEPGDEVIISEMEHHSNIVPWQQVCRERGATLKFIPINEHAELILEEYQRLLSPKTKLVAIAHIANSTGTCNPIEQLISMAHERGAKVLIDGAQSAPHIPIDVQRLGADFFVFSGHKAFGPNGVGVLYGKKELLEEMPPYQYGGDMIQTVSLLETTFQHTPLKFEAGTPLIGQVIAFGEALLYIEHIGRDNIASWESKLLTYATEKLLEIPDLRIIGTAANKGPIISFVIKDIHPLDLGTLLDLRGIAVRTGHQCAQPLMHHFGISAVTRVSFAIYNTFEEIEIFIEALKEVIKLLKS
jgi:cysteine desulfurase / selenocysteine lyase